MKSLQNWLDEYGSSHQNKTNKMVHYICVPLITWSTLGIFWFLSPYLFWGLVLVSMLFYLKLSPRIAIGMGIFVGVSQLFLLTHPQAFTISIAVFVVSWVAQIWGHKIEGKKPSFLKDIQFLLIGPAWIMNMVMNHLTPSHNISTASKSQAVES